MKPYLEKIQTLVKDWEEDWQKDFDQESENTTDTLEAFINAVKEKDNNTSPNQKEDYWTALKDLVNSFDRNELDDFFYDLLYENGQLLGLPLFKESKIISKFEAAFNWLMDLPYVTIEKASKSLEKIYDNILGSENLSHNDAIVARKIEALTAKNRRGLPYQYLKRKSKQEHLLPHRRLRLTQLMILHEEYDFDFARIEKHIKVTENPFLLPALMEAYIKQPNLENAHIALKLLNNFDEDSFPISGCDLQVDMEHVLKEIGRILRRENPAGWQDQLVSFADYNLIIANDWLQDLVDNVLGIPVFSNSSARIDLIPQSESLETKISEDISEIMNLISSAFITLDEIKDIALKLRNDNYRKLWFDLFAQKLKRDEENKLVPHLEFFFSKLSEKSINIEQEFGKRNVLVQLTPPFSIETATYEYSTASIEVEEPFDFDKYNEKLSRELSKPKIEEFTDFIDDTIKNIPFSSN